MEGDIIPENSFLIEEAVGIEPVGVPMTKDQELYLQHKIDPMVDKLIADMDYTLKIRKQSDDYQRRTLPELNGG